MPDPLPPYAPPADIPVVPSGPEARERPSPAGVPRLRPLLARALDLYRSRLSSLVVIVLVVYIPIDLVLEALPAEGDQLHSLGRYLRVQRSLEYFFGVLCTMAIANLVQAARNGNSLGAGECFGEAGSRWRSSLWTQLLVNGALILGLLALVLPVLLVGVATYFSLSFVALRGLSGIAAIKASRRLVKGRFWEVFRLVALLLLTELAFILLLSAPFLALPDHYLISVTHSLIVDLVASLFVVAEVLLFLDLEARDPAEPSTVSSDPSTQEETP